MRGSCISAVQNDCPTAHSTTRSAARCRCFLHRGVSNFGQINICVDTVLFIRAKRNCSMAKSAAPGGDAHIPTQRWWIGGYVTVYAGIQSEKRSICVARTLPKGERGNAFLPHSTAFMYFLCFFFYNYDFFKMK